jgi:hypothetical protein
MLSTRWGFFTFAFVTLPCPPHGIYVALLTSRDIRHSTLNRGNFAHREQTTNSPWHAEWRVRGASRFSMRSVGIESLRCKSLSSYGLREFKRMFKRMPSSEAKGRRTRFQARIAAERGILTIVNSSELCRDSPLAGMTAQAIADWERRARHKLEPGRAAKVADLLLEIGRRTELLADDSRDVFGANELVQRDDGVDQAQAELRRLVAGS